MQYENNPAKSSRSDKNLVLTYRLTAFLMPLAEVTAAKTPLIVTYNEINRKVIAFKRNIYRQENSLCSNTCLTTLITVINYSKRDVRRNSADEYANKRS